MFAEGDTLRNPGDGPLGRRDSGLLGSALRHFDADAVGAAARRESRNREAWLPPVSIYRWWARRTESVSGALLDAISLDRPGRLVVADPFAGGGVIPLAAAIRGHAVYAQDINPWASTGLALALKLRDPEAIEDAAQLVHATASQLLDSAYSTCLSDGSPGTVAHTFRVATVACVGCAELLWLFPHALVTLRRRKDQGGSRALLACPAGHLFEGEAHNKTHCPECGRTTHASSSYTPGRRVSCPHCGETQALEVLAQSPTWSWRPVLVERVAHGRREISTPTPAEILQAEGPQWHPQLQLGSIPHGRETRVLLRHGFTDWADLYPRRQRVVLEALLSSVKHVTADENLQRLLTIAVAGSAEMAGYLSRWDRWYLKSYESMAGHRFNFTTLTVEPNVWGVATRGRGSVSNRIRLIARAARWLRGRLNRSLRVHGPIHLPSQHTALDPSADAWVVSGSSATILLPNRSVDLVLTDPPYHDDVQYSELSLPLRVWADMSTASEPHDATVNDMSPYTRTNDSYQRLLRTVFREVGRVLRADGHFILSYANRDPEAWIALIAALQDADFEAVGYSVVHSENELDYAKRHRRACTSSLLVDLVPAGKHGLNQWSPTDLPASDQEAFLRLLGHFMLRVGRLRRGWTETLRDKLLGSSYLRDGTGHTPSG